MTKKTTKAVCIHGHFYQPPRENPITNQIPNESGASPYSNWNERINDQCYRPNAELGNFKNISFNIGPTLAQWLTSYDPATLKMIINQDWVNYQRNGVGNAMAQPFNHPILPLATMKDKWTQIIWGIEDFKFHFSHFPAGMWLPETAVDIETLDILAQNGIQFTILAPWQADVDNLDVSQPYWVDLMEGRKIAVFFYHQELSTKVSFDPGSTANADDFIQRSLIPQFSSAKDIDQLLLIASDGEAYGHHHQFRDKFLTYLLADSIKTSPIQNTYPALWLQTHMPIETIKIRENTSWSCHHGIKRWSDQCGCSTNGIWKKPLRQAFDQIADAIDQEYLHLLSGYSDDPWDVLYKYIVVIHKKSDVGNFIREQIKGDLGQDEINKIALILNAQYERQRIFTSCGWFFEDFDRIEPRNNVRYAAQAVWSTYLATGKDLKEIAIKAFRNVKSWRSPMTADIVFQQHLERIQNSPNYAAEPLLSSN